LLYFFDFRHDLWNPVKNADSGQQEQNAPNQLQFGFLFIFHKKVCWSVGVLE
jgi:hypothetical protein